jgi:hypothetical protein
MNPRDHCAALVLTMVTSNQNFRASTVPLSLELGQNGTPNVVGNTNNQYFGPDMGAGLIEDGAGRMGVVSRAGGL